MLTPQDLIELTVCGWQGQKHPFLILTDESVSLKAILQA
jgi:hypothetical protein